VNEPSKKELLPSGLCSIFLYGKKNQFIGYYRGDVNGSGLRESKGCLYVFQNGDYFEGDK
jgi:hypothetical protein